MFGVELPAGRVIERVDPLTLEPDELALLDLLGPPMLVATPRAVKRLANSYGLLTAIRRHQRAADLAEQHATIAYSAGGELQEVAFFPYRAGMVCSPLSSRFRPEGCCTKERLCVAGPPERILATQIGPHADPGERRVGLQYRL